MLEAIIFGGITSPLGVHHLNKISSQDSLWFGRSIDRKFEVASHVPRLC
jgi:hypothetical protein